MPRDERKLTIQARLMWADDSPHPGKGVGRWHKYYTAEGMDEAKWASRDLVKSAQIRVLHGREVVAGPMRVSEFLDA